MHRRRFLAAAAAATGAALAADAFVIAYRIPNLLRRLVAEGALTSAFVPTFTHELTHRGKRDAWRLANNVMTTLLVATAVVAANRAIEGARPLRFNAYKIPLMRNLVKRAIRGTGTQATT